MNVQQLTRSLCKWTGLQAAVRPAMQPVPAAACRSHLLDLQRTLLAAGRTAHIAMLGSSPAARQTAAQGRPAAWLQSHRMLVRCMLALTGTLPELQHS